MQKRGKFHHVSWGAPKHIVVVRCSEAYDYVNRNSRTDAVLVHWPPAVPEGATGPPRGDIRDLPREDPAAPLRHRDPSGPWLPVHQPDNQPTRVLQPIYPSPDRRTIFT